MVLNALLVVVFFLFTLAGTAHAKDLRIPIPRHSQLTRVQQLNREGVDAVRKHQYNKARTLFYKAYLFDPGDPFTLNNLGYLAELEGDADRAQSFYSAASAFPSSALIDRASSSKLEGQSLATATSSVQNVPMRINRANSDAVRLLTQGRVREADELLQQTLALDPKNAFTLNNVGVVKESQGEYNDALRYYDAASIARVEEPAIITTKAALRGKPLSEMARGSAARLRARIKSLDTNDAKVAILNLRGVAALNRNNFREARESFSQAYKLSPHNAFSLNNQGVLAELGGDLESAQEFYRDAQSANAAEIRIGLATRAHAEGKKLFSVAEESEDQTSIAIVSHQQAKRRRRGPVELKRRDGTPVVEQKPASQPNPPQEPTTPEQQQEPR